MPYIRVHISIISCHIDITHLLSLLSLRIPFCFSRLCLELTNVELFTVQGFDWDKATAIVAGLAACRGPALQDLSSF